ncbi:MAG: TolC family protein [Muribaculaceae bacterium]|nr:TolC family protein [Muribaculaceae bacterium]
MKKIFTSISIALSIAAAAQEPWSMEQCMAYAAEHASSVIQARWDVSSATATRNEALADFFPSLSAQVGSQFSWGRNIDPETNTYNNVTTFNNGYGIYASLTLFDGGQTLNRYRQARSERERYLNAVEMKQDDSAISAMLAFADAVYYQNSIKIAEERLMQSEGMLRLTKSQEELGIKGLPDVVQAEATVANDKYSLVHQQNLYEQAMLTLKSAMNFPQIEPLCIDTTSPKTPSGYTDENVENIYNQAILTNPQAIEARMQVRSKKYSYNIAMGYLLPTISINAGISTSFYKNINSEYTVPIFGEQFRNNLGEYISATLSIPIFNGLSRISGKNRAKYAYEQAKEQLKEQNRRLHDEIASAVMDRDGYAMEIISLKAKVDSDGEAYRLNKRKYEEGLMSLIDLQLSANTYYSSKVEMLQKQMLYLLKDKLVEYYKGNRLWM